MLDFLYLGTKLRENNRNRLPHQFVINGKISMGKLVPHSRDLPPGDFGMIVGKCRGQMFDCFTNDQKIEDDGIGCF